MVRTGMRGIIELIRKHPKIRRILRCESPYFHHCGERLTAERAATMSWYDEMVVARRSKSLTTGNVRCGVTAVHEVLGSLALETPVNCQSELMEDSLGNIELCASTSALYV